MTTLANAYNDILARAGEGYSAFYDRARALFWRALGSIIASGEHQDHEVDKISSRDSETVQADQYPISRAAALTQLVFKAIQTIRVTQPPNVRCDKLNYDQFLSASDDMLYICKSAGVNQLLWTETPTEIHLKYSADHLAQATTQVETDIVSVNPNVLTSSQDSSSIETYISYSLAVRAVELATQMIIQEMRG